MPTKTERLLALIEANPELADALLETAEELSRIVEDVTPEQPGDLGSIEDGIDSALDGLGREVLRRVLRRMSPTVSVVEHDGRLWRRMRDATPGVCFSRRGEVRFERHLYRDMSVRNGPTIAPAELTGGLIDGRWTPRAAEAVCELVQNGTARDAAATAKRLGVVPYSAAAMGRLAEHVGTEWDAHRAAIENACMASYEVPDGVRSVSLAADRVAVRVREGKAIGWRMAYCGVVALHDEDGETLDAFRYGWMPTPTASDDLAEALRGDLDALRAQRPDLRIVVLSDGAPEMKRILEDAVDGIEGVERALDFWHAVERVAEAARSAGLDTKVEVAAAKELLLSHDDGARRLVERVSSWRRRTRKKTTREEVASVVGYLENNVGRMAYRALRAKNLPIGSGHVEATCKTLVSVRMKRAGAQWSMQGGQAILGLRSLARSSRWDDGMRHLLGRWVKPVVARGA